MNDQSPQRRMSPLETLENFAEFVATVEGMVAQLCSNGFTDREAREIVVAVFQAQNQ